VTGVVAKSAHEIPDRLPLQLVAGERVDASERSSEWREHVFVTASGGAGWVPVRSLSGSSGMVTVRTAYDTTELATSPGEPLEVIKEDIRSGWLWCRSREGREGWVPLSTLDRAG
jgi:SH3-like domain-containing protein